MTTPQFIYFDLGNVLLSFSHEQSAQQAADLTGCSYAAAWDALFGSGNLEVEYETGLCTSAEFHQRFSRITKTQSPQAEFLHATSAMFLPLWDTIVIAAQLHYAGHRLGILSNTCEAHWQYCYERFAFLRRFFSLYVLSYEEQSMKPQPPIYRRACEKAELSAGEIFFVDDRTDNVAAARSAGIDAELFTTPRQLARDLAARNVPMNF